jgi:hypothetical protein
VSGRQIHVVYMVPSGAIDGGLDTNGTLEHSVGSFQNWLASKTGVRLRQDTWQGRPDISFFRSTLSDWTISVAGRRAVNLLYQELSAAGFSDPATVYLIYYHGANNRSCGSAIQNGPAAALYLRGSGETGCGGAFASFPFDPPGYREFAMLHELFHVLGAVDTGAPHHDERSPAHVYDTADLMHGGYRAWRPTYVDRHNDDYFGGSLPAGLRNVANDPIFIPATGASIAPALMQSSIPQLMPYFPHEVIRWSPPSN